LAISRRAFRQLMILAIGSVVLFLTPYWLWSQGNIPQYRTATFFALGLVIILALVGRQIMNVSLTRSTSTPSVTDK
ncbi:MAG TPA: hypothetical protein VLG46_13520, partial [Anaerolineae bacterium]|nr:hypothetical protein [Anaerolineae bacterium]